MRQRYFFRSSWVPSSVVPPVKQRTFSFVFRSLKMTIMRGSFVFGNMTLSVLYSSSLLFGKTSQFFSSCKAGSISFLICGFCFGYTYISSYLKIVSLFYIFLRVKYWSGGYRKYPFFQDFLEDSAAQGRSRT